MIVDLKAASPAARADGAPGLPATHANRETPRGLWVYVGPSGAGETSHVRQVARYYGATLISQDDFLLAPADRRGDGLHHKYDWDELDFVLGELLAGCSVEYAPFTPVARRREGKREIAPTHLAVGEGITLLLGSVAAQRLATLRVYVDAPLDVRTARQLARLERAGHYRDMPRGEVERQILAKGRTEDPLIERQIARCDWLLDTAQPLLVPLPAVAHRPPVGDPAAA